MKKIAALILPLLLVVAVGIAACGKTPGGGGNGGGGSPAGDTISMDAANFTQHGITVKINTPVHLDDTANGGGGTHIICLGTGNGGTNSCSASGTVPSVLLNSGLMVQSGDKKDVTFTTAGTYHIICTLHTGMFIDVTVK